MSYIDFSIISQIYLHVLPIAICYTKHLTAHTICVCLNPLPSILLSRVIFRNKSLTILYTLVYTGGAKVTVQLNNRVLTVGKSHTQNAADGCMTTVTQSQHLLLASCAVHPPTDTHTVTQTLLPIIQQQHSPHPVPQTHITVHNACHSRVHKHRY